MTARNAKSFIVEDVKWPGAAGAIYPVGHGEKAGEFAGINHACPCGCGAWSFIAFDGYPVGPTWTILSGKSGGTDMTLTPSIGVNPRGADGSYHWHGFLRNGVFEEG